MRGASPPSLMKIVPSGDTATPNKSEKRACHAPPSRAPIVPSPAIEETTAVQSRSSGRSRIETRRVNHATATAAATSSAPADRIQIARRTLKL